MKGQIYDLSYRNYDGPLNPPRFRWWTIARHGVRLALKKRAVWVLSILSAWYYLAMLIVLFFVERAASANPLAENGVPAFLQRIRWPDQFLHGYSYAQLPLLLLALLLGAGSIANDNRTHALLVYLSKPCTRFDYVFGKWLSVFLPILIVSAVPTFLFYGYAVLSFRDYGFLDDPWLLAKILAVLPLGAAFHASLVVGISSLFNQGRMAGATYAGLYFLTNFFTVVMKGVWISSDGDAPAAVKYLFYASIDGLQIGACKALLGTDGSPAFGIMRRQTEVPAPPLGPVLGIMIGLGVVAMTIAWSRVRAVEVVG
jgi:ABC-2 type transport system permease protein